jgi:uncharacterized membrane protein HdeD (DUF308 family)
MTVERRALSKTKRARRDQRNRRVSRLLLAICIVFIALSLVLVTVLDKAVYALVMMVPGAFVIAVGAISIPLARGDDLREDWLGYYLRWAISGLVAMVIGLALLFLLELVF